MPLNPENLTNTESLIADLHDEELAACVGGCDLEVTVGEQALLTVPLVESKLLGYTYVNTCINILDLALDLGVTYDPNGSRRFLSDRNVKEAVAEVDVHDILKGIVDLPITTWKYKNQDETIRHIGPMAQDFAATFNCGESDRFINAVDANGVALAAIQALYQLIQQKDSQIRELQIQLLQLQQQVITK
ncbi:tail fiber domain-containing protein [Tolypothrix sp. FACHB-123]|uniref:tail fiber domain-containing protein n=1 Tax=Tolypothrix sp. FACHB-123 TaxID=2692868 RepID=UPI0016831237|nr:tail fiber domain-containing protein [Tolypothrix sp. FACHB-123]MBD2354972.1 tail fiber domain-containing protein [Tolypothrix sp. FACHB-123]